MVGPAKEIVLTHLVCYWASCGPGPDPGDRSARIVKEGASASAICLEIFANTFCFTERR